MKTKMMKVMAFVALVAGLASCTQSTVLDDMSTQDIQKQVSTQGGGWTVEEFVDDGDNYTSAFSGWTFEFNADGSLEADDNIGKTHLGNWFIDDDDTPSHRDFVITISGTYELLEMSDDWAMEEVSDNRIALFDEDKGVRTEVLVFVK